jgi:NAD+ kinase
MVLSDTLLLRIAIPHGSRSTAYCSFDGKGRVELRQGDYVTVEASAYPFPTVLANSGEWFESVRRTLRWNVRGAVQKGWSGNVHPPSQVRNIDEDGTPSDMMSPAWNGEEDDADEKWDIDTDAETPGTDSGFGQSEDGDSCPGGPGSPIWAFNGKLFA